MLIGMLIVGTKSVYACYMMTVRYKAFHIGVALCLEQIFYSFIANQPDLVDWN